MTTISDEQLLAHASRAKGKVAVITGGANGIGKEAALLFAKHGAKVVIGDLDVKGGEGTVAEIRGYGGEAVFQRCNVLDWDEQLSLFELAMKEYGSVDVVVPNAGVAEAGTFGRFNLVDGKLSKPKLLTLEVNLTGVMYTTHLGLHYIKKNHTKGSLKALVFIGSMASWQAIPAAPMYSASKHAILGLMRSLYTACQLDGIRVAVIHPFFADTHIVPTTAKVFLAGIPLTPVARIAGAIFCATTDPDMESSGCAWLLPDDGPVYRIEKEQFKEGVYKMIDERTKMAIDGLVGVKRYAAVVRDLWRILGKKLVLAIGCVIVARVLWTSGFP
ncbi:hypothetical protein JAAARDRAFT_37225 [Jaapia argillacea MUCL 33604]|uniref:NAD(P)-binding protein n=1 Tax=Jaapia argillacea MUCL 33604 TaxID=933084 RepID=A0A067PLT9_9AGAM|nr:hypothetical protein JAAARDRAFT_37225 [Jaapia argillacea MUCL 33604]